MYRPVGKNDGGCVGRIGNSLSGSPMMFLMILNLSGSSLITGLIFRATGLYFFLPSRFINISLIGC